MLKNTIIGWIAGAILGYLIQAFIFQELNPVKWTETVRFFYCLLTAAGAFMGATKPT